VKKKIRQRAERPEFPIKKHSSLSGNGTATVPILAWSFQAFWALLDLLAQFIGAFFQPPALFLGCILF
jgi:hypothetical protein